MRMATFNDSAHIFPNFVKSLDDPLNSIHVLIAKFREINIIFFALSILQCLLLHPKFHSQSSKLFRRSLGPLTITWWLVSPYKFPTTPLDFNAGRNALHALCGMLMFFKTVDWTLLDGPIFMRSFKRSNGVAQWEYEISPLSNQKDGPLEIVGWLILNLIGLRGYDFSWGIAGAMGNNLKPLETFLQLLRLAIILVPSMSFNVLAYKTPSKSPVDTLISLGLVPFPGIAIFANSLLAITYGLSISYFQEVQICALVLANHLIHPLTQILGLPAGVCNFFDPARWPPLIGPICDLSSLAFFWGKCWHQLFRRGFLVSGGKPFLWLASCLTNCKNLQRAAGLVGVFAISGFFHEYPFYIITQKPWTEFNTLPTTFLFFFIQAFGIIAEPFIIPQIPKWLGGGKLWTLTFLIATSPLLIGPYQNHGGLVDLLSSPVTALTV